jgi:hypothetical protein
MVPGLHLTLRQIKWRVVARNREKGMKDDLFEEIRQFGLFRAFGRSAALFQGKFATGEGAIRTAVRNDDDA